LEVCVTWLQVALHAGHAAALPRAEAVLASVGRMKYLKPLYRALADRPETRERARAVFATADGRPDGAATVYAMTDEFHQSFHASRQGSWIDVGIDSVGATLGVLLFVKGVEFIERRRRRPR
jgi:hypothetical protein